MYVNLTDGYVTIGSGPVAVKVQRSSKLLKEAEKLLLRLVRKCT